MSSYHSVAKIILKSVAGACLLLAAVSAGAQSARETGAAGNSASSQGASSQSAASSTAAGLGASKTGGGTAPAGASALPLSGVTLYVGGVGYFQRNGSVAGNAEIELSFKTAEVNDLLKSLTVRDLDGGRVTGVSYGSQDPIQKRLGSYAINLAGKPGLPDILTQLRGENLVAATPEPVEGLVVGVETLNNPEGIPQLHLTLLAQDGLRTFALSDIQSLRFTSPRVQDDFRKALGVLAESHDADKKTIRLGFAGQGTRRVSVGYLTEAPAWKTAYRLVLDDKGAHFLQGWAIVENATDEDWKGVNLSLVSGRPISFVMDLATPRYIQRPVVRQTTAAGPAPQTYDDALSAPKSAPPRPAAAPMPSASSAKMAERSYAEASAADEMEDNYLAEELSAQSYGAGVAPGATMESAGNLVRYRIASPVDLGRRESAMFPLVDGIVAGKRVSVYDQRVDAKRPLAGVELTNSTAYSLLAGPMTIFDGGSYAGDALIDDFLPKAERLVTYAVDMETEVAPSPESSAQTILSMKIAKGIFNLSLSARREKAYTLKNSGSRDKEVILVKALEAAWKLLQPTKDVETTRDSYRFRVALPAGGNAALTVVEERTFGQSFGLASMNDTQFAYYSGMGTASPELKRAFAGIAERRAAVKATAADRQEAERKLKQVKDEQSRIRSNMGSLSNSSDLYKKYVAMLAEQESAIAALLESIDTLYARERRLSTELEAYIQSLQV